MLISGRLPDFPWDHLDDVRRAGARTSRRDRRPLGRHARSTRRRRSCRRRCARPPTRRATRSRSGCRRPGRSAVDWLERCHGVTGLDIDQVLPVIGSKELIASLPLHLGIGPGDLVVQPALAYPTYEVGAVLAGAEVIATDSLTAIGPRTPRLLWLNSPSNPTGRVLPPDHLRKVVDWCRERGRAAGQRRVLPRVHLGGRGLLRAPPRRLRRLARGDPRGALAVQALQPGRLPVRVRRR